MTDAFGTAASVDTHEAIERTLGAIWRDVLNGTAIDAEDSFVALGGDSIAATLCAIRIRETFGVEVPMTDFFTELTTLRMMAQRVSGLRRQESGR